MFKQILLLAAGKSSRFFPYNEDAHKSQINICGQPIIYWTLDGLKNKGIKEVIVVINQDNQSLYKLLSDYQADYQLKIAYQQKPLGQADAILCARHELKQRFLLIDHSQVDVSKHFDDLLSIQSEIVLGVKPTHHPEKYGIVTVNKDNLVTSVVEKPNYKIDNPYRIFGYWVLTREFVDYMAKLEKKEYLLETCLNDYAQEKKVKPYLYEAKTPTNKYAWDLLSLKNFILPLIKPHISQNAIISDTAIIKGDVFIDDEALIGDYAIIEGPAYIGKKAVVGRYCVVRKRSVLEEGAQIQSYGDINDSILMKDSHIHSGFVGNSIIGEHCRIGADFVTANRRQDREEIFCYVKGKKVNTKTTRLGTIIGHNAKIGIRVSTMPNVIIKNNAIIDAGAMVKRNIT